jgi:hypothetical protein
MQILRRALFLAAVCCAATPARIEAQENQTEALLHRVDSLERRIADLEARISQLESPRRAEPAANRAQTGNSRDLANWRRLREGMTYEQVRTILGEPVRIRGGGVAFWTYPRGGEVGFVSGRLSSWKEPD